MTTSKTFLSLLAALTMLGAVGLSSCNTVRGAGQDVQAAGSAVSHTATEVQEDIEDDDAN